MIEDKDVDFIADRVKDKVCDKIMEQVKLVCVTRSECTNTTTEITNKLSNDDKRLAVIQAYQKITLGVMGAIGGGVLTMLIKMFFGEV